MFRPDTHYIIRFSDPDSKAAHISEPYDSDIVATRKAKEQCSPGWNWQIFKMAPKVIASGSVPA
jgi:hypothetical protein